MTPDQLQVTGGARTIHDGRELTPRQQTVWDHVRTTHGGITADEAGALLHQHANKLPGETRCAYCALDGKSVLRSKPLRALTTRKRDGHYRPRDPRDALRPAEPGEIPF